MLVGRFYGASPLLAVEADSLLLGVQHPPLTRATLPVELVLKVLDFVAPSLSVPQRTRICDYARDRMTLPSLALQLPGVTQSNRWNADKECIPDPTTEGTTGTFGLPALPSPPTVRVGSVDLGATRSPSVWNVTPAPGVSGANQHDCSNGCRGGLWCRREEHRLRWLEEVACFWYEP
jgi:hypothetical protein